MLRHAGFALSYLAAALPAAAQGPPPIVVEGEDFAVYADGRASSFAEVLAALDEVDVVLVGEEHDDMVGHGVELELLMRLVERYGPSNGVRPPRPVTLSMEMFETDVQHVVDEYLDGLITEDHFKASSRPWPDYELRYRPLVEFARREGVPLLAANAPRRYVNRVSRLGPDGLNDLPEHALATLPPLPTPGPSAAYRAEWDALMTPAAHTAEGEAGADSADAPAHPTGEGTADATESPYGDGMRYALDAQALWDAGMSHSIAGVLDRYPWTLVLHLVGSFHVRNGTGIPEVLPGYRPGTRAVTVVMVPDHDIHVASLEERAGLADFVILTRELGHGAR